MEQANLSRVIAPTLSRQLFMMAKQYTSMMMHVLCMFTLRKYILLQFQSCLQS